MPNPAITRAQVHFIGEVCADEGDAFQSTARRLLMHQTRLRRFFEQNAAPMGMMPAQVAIHMLSVTLRIIEQVGGRVRKVTGRELTAATNRVDGAVAALMPPDAEFPERAKAWMDRAQPHILDEVLWALYERDKDELREGEVDLEPGQSAMIYVMMWTAVEALDMVWRPPKGWDPSAWTPPDTGDEGEA